MSADKNTVSGATMVYAPFNRGHAQALLEHGFRLGELRLGVDAAHVILRVSIARRHAHIASNGHSVAEIDIRPWHLPLPMRSRIVERMLRPSSAIRPPLTKTDLALFGGRIALLADSDKFTSAHQSAGHSPSDRPA